LTISRSIIGSSLAALACLSALATPAEAAERHPNGHELCEFRTPLHRHKVFRGEIGYGIAGLYGVTLEDLKKLNPRDLKNADKIKPGMHLVVCPEIEPRERIEDVYVVESGDYLGKVAELHGLTIRELLRFQRRAIKNKDRLRVGQKILVWQFGEVLGPWRKKRDQDKGKFRDGAKLLPHSSYHIKRPKRVWGTRSTVGHVRSVLSRYQKKYGGPRVVMGDLSKEGGGPLSGHASHQLGTDVDVGYVFKGENKRTKGFLPANHKNLDIRRTWGLVHEFLKTGNIRYIFIDYGLQKLLYKEAIKRGVSESKLDQWFQYPRGKGRTYGIVRHWRNHHDHMHVRFRH
jgi:LysM repeat protein